jgi:glucose-6-phosphate isomerase
MMGTTTTASQAWAILSRHAREEISLLRLQELCRDNDRVSSLVSVYNTTFTSNCRLEKNVDIIENRMLIADLSRQRMTLDTVNHLFRLAAATNLRTFITRLAWGQNNPSHPVLPVRVKGIRPAPDKVDTTATIPSMHFAMRAPAGKSYEMLTKDGVNALTGIHLEWERIERYSNSIRRGHLRGISGHMIRDVVVVGRGVPMAALQFIYSALIRDERACVFRRVGLADSSSAAERIRRNLAGVTAGGGARQLHFLTRVDPLTAAAVVADLDPASTLVISIALNGNEETGLATKILKTWLLNALAKSGRPDHILAKHMMLVTGNDDIANVINKPESVHIIPQHSRCEAFSSTSAACLLVSFHSFTVN